MDNITYVVVSNCISNKLSLNNIVWTKTPRFNSEPVDEILNTLKTQCCLFDNLYNKTFIRLTNSFTQTLCCNEFLDTLQELVNDDEINWGRVISILCYASTAALHLAKLKRNNEIDLIHEWTCNFINRYVNHWIELNGGWESIVTFFKNENEKNSNTVIFKLGALVLICLWLCSDV